MARQTALTDKQRRVFDYILDTVRERGRSPTVREIAGHFHWRSPRSAQKHITYLIQKGMLEKDHKVWRGLGVNAVAARWEALRGVPLLGEVPAGRPVDAVEHWEGTLGIDPNLFPEADVFALRVKGASMTGAGIRDGDLALVRQTPDAHDGDLVVAVLDGETTLKRFFQKKGRVVLHPENPDFQDIVVKPEMDFSLSGVVIGVIRRV